MVFGEAWLANFDRSGAARGWSSVLTGMSPTNALVGFFAEPESEVDDVIGAAGPKAAAENFEGKRVEDHRLQRGTARQIVHVGTHLQFRGGATPAGTPPFPIVDHLCPILETIFFPKPNKK